MRNLIEITRDFFTRYARKKLGRDVPWHKLNKQRQQEWVEDSYIMIEELLVLVEKEIDAPIIDKNTNSSYERGMQSGINKERNRLKSVFLDVKQKYLQDLKGFLE